MRVVKEMCGCAAARLAPSSHGGTAWAYGVVPHSLGCLGPSMLSPLLFLASTLLHTARVLAAFQALSCVWCLMMLAACEAVSAIVQAGDTVSWPAARQWHTRSSTAILSARRSGVACDPRTSGVACDPHSLAPGRASLQLLRLGMNRPQPSGSHC